MSFSSFPSITEKQERSPFHVDFRHFFLRQIYKRLLCFVSLAALATVLDNCNKLTLRFLQSGSIHPRGKEKTHDSVLMRYTNNSWKGNWTHTTSLMCFGVWDAHTLYPGSTMAVLWVHFREKGNKKYVPGLWINVFGEWSFEKPVFWEDDSFTLYSCLVGRKEASSLVHKFSKFHMRY